MKKVLLLIVFLAAALSSPAQTVVTDAGVSPDEMPRQARKESEKRRVESGERRENTNIKGKDSALDTKEKDKSLSSLHSPLSSFSPSSVLLIGDSMCDGLGSRFSDYAAKNGFKLHTVIWYGSTSKSWATTYELQYHIERVRPDYIIFSLGTNDLGFYDYEQRERWIKEIIKKIGDIPYLWIGPLQWRRVRDRTIVDIIRRNTGEKHFYDSTNTYCQRLDGIHPTFPAAARWVDEIVKWMGNPSVIATPVVMERPDSKAVFRPDERHSPKYRGRMY